MITIKGTGLVGELICGMDADLIVDVPGQGPIQVPAELVEVVPGGDEDDVDQQVISTAQRKATATMETYTDDAGVERFDNCGHDLDDCPCACTDCGDGLVECACIDGPSYPVVANYGDEDGDAG